MNKQIKIITAVILLAAILGSNFLISCQSKLKDKNEKLEMRVDSLLTEKASLIEEIEGLQVAFSQEESRTDSLSAVVADMQAEIDKRNAAAQKIKQQQTREVKVLKKEIEELRKIRTESESIIAQLKKENEALLAKTNELTETVENMEAENIQLTEKGEVLKTSNEELQKSVTKLKAATFKASGFQIDVDKKSGKVTTSAKRARNIDVGFDINNVPNEHQGSHTLYLVITNETATPIKVDNPIRVRVTSREGKVFEIEAQQEKQVNISENQRIEFSQELDSKLAAGKYKATVYAKKMGLLGSSRFVLR